VIDGNLVSGRTWHDHGQYMKAWMSLLIAERNKRLGYVA
jgi:protease I